MSLQLLWLESRKGLAMKRLFTALLLATLLLGTSTLPLVPVAVAWADGGD